jgi:hypothetical protein
MKSKEVTVVFRTYGRVTNGVVDTIRFLFLFLSEFLFCLVSAVTKRDADRREFTFAAYGEKQSGGGLFVSR